MKRVGFAILFTLFLPALAAAEQAPDFEAPGRDGATLRLADFRGRVVLLDFWASWCGACRNELPRLAALEKDVEGLVVLAVNVDTERERVERFAASVRLPRRVVLDPKGAIAERFDIPAMPWQVLLGKDGRVLRAGRRVVDDAAALRAELRRLGVTE